MRVSGKMKAKYHVLEWRRGVDKQEMQDTCKTSRTVFGYSIDVGPTTLPPILGSQQARASHLASTRVHHSRRLKHRPASCRLSARLQPRPSSESRAGPATSALAAIASAEGMPLVPSDCQPTRPSGRNFCSFASARSRGQRSCVRSGLPRSSASRTRTFWRMT